MHITTFATVIVAAKLAAAATHLVTVGGPDQLIFNPSYVSADIGDIVRFEFHVKNHTATQSSFLTPCSPLAGGFDSGFQFVAPDQTWDFPYKEFEVTNTNPAWFYCQQGTHCSMSGMVFAVNPGVPPATNTFDAFKAIAQGGAPPPAAPPSGGDYPYPGDYPAPTATYPSNPDPTSAYPPATHTVVVGGSAGNVYTPSNITANVGDIITFQFKQKNHTVTQSSFNNPCSKLDHSSSPAGFDSGFNFFVAPDATEFPTYSIRVNDTAPIWAYCRQDGQPPHCVQGMVFSVNADENGPNNFAAFQAKARASSGTASGGGFTAKGAASPLTVGSFSLFGAFMSAILML